MSMKFISIVGSVDENRTYDPPGGDPAEARNTAESLGMELAKRGYGIIVYAGDYIERDVVRGFVKKAREKKSIKVLFPSVKAGPGEFPEYKSATHKPLFDPEVDDSTDWEMSFYGSLVKVDGVVVIGGAQSTLITGVLALTYHIPIIALRAYGGSGAKIWNVMKRGKGLATAEEVNEMSHGPDEGSIARWVDSLGTQAQEARRRLSNKSAVQWAWTAVGLVVVWILALPLGYSLLPPGGADPNGQSHHAFLVILFLAPMVAGASGATVRMLLPDASTPTARTMALGVTAGAIAGVLYVVSHLVANPNPHSFAILVIAVTFGFIAGLTFDNVFKKLESVDPLRLDALKQAK